MQDVTITLNRNEQTDLLDAINDRREVLEGLINEPWPADMEIAAWTRESTRLGMIADRIQQQQQILSGEENDAEE